VRPTAAPSPPAGTRIVPKNVADLYLQAAERYGELPAFLKKVGGAWDALSFCELFDAGAALATALMDLGVEVFTCKRRRGMASSPRF